MENSLNNGHSVIHIYIKGRKHSMDLPEQRIIGALILLAGISFLALGLYENQLTTVLEIIGEMLNAAIAG
jgi:hypothetical protein